MEVLFIPVIFCGFIFIFALAMLVYLFFTKNIIKNRTTFPVIVDSQQSEIYTTDLSGANTGFTKPSLHAEMTLSNLPDYFEAEHMKRIETLPAYDTAINKMVTSL